MTFKHQLHFKRIKSSAQVVLFLVVIAAIAAGCGGPGGSGPDPNTDFRAIGSDAYVYGEALVLAYQYLYNSAVNPNSGQFMAPFNTIHNIARIASPDDVGIPVPNCDTPYSWLWMDLRTEPLVISVPDVAPPRYFVVQLSDANMFNFAYIGSRTTGQQGGNYLVAGPDWKGETYPGIKQVFRSGASFALALFRTQLFSPDDLPNVVAIQAGYKVQPLSSYLGLPPPTPAAHLDWPEFHGLTGDLGLDDFLVYLDFILRFAPPGPEEIKIRQELAQIGVGPSKKFDYDDLTSAQKAEVQQGLQDGMNKRQDYVFKTGIKFINGWGLGDLFGDRAFYNGDWMKRAAGAWNGGFGNTAEEALYPVSVNLRPGEPLDGSKHKYTITFGKGQLPPAKAFWSLTMYDYDTKRLVKNPINRYLINSTMLSELKMNDDGSLTIYVQRDAPGEDSESNSNWLPAPDGPIYMVLRMYWPNPDPPSVLPPGEGTWNPPPFVVAD